MAISLYRTKLIGNKYNLLTVENFNSVASNGHLIWDCRCDCGNLTKARTESLTRGKVKSCGCLQKKSNSNHRAWKGYEEISLSRFNKYKYDAIKHKRPFNLTIEYLWELFLKQNRCCKYSGRLITFANRKMDRCTASLDRIDSNKGYTIDNVQWVHRDVNYMKQTLTEKEFLTIVEEIYNSTIGLIDSTADCQSVSDGATPS